MNNIDFEGREAAVSETKDTIIKVWEITTTPAADYDSYVIRGWQDMLGLVNSKIESLLEDQVIDEESPEVHIRVRLIEMTKGELDEIEENSTEYFA